MTKHFCRTTILAAPILLGLVFLSLGCNPAPPAAAPDTRADDEAAIRKADTDWSKAAQSKKVDDWMAYYTDETTMLPPNDKVATGKDTVRKAVGELLGLPGLSISWEPVKIEVAKSADIAYSRGTYVFNMTGPKGKPITDHGKYIEVWKKQADGAWKCIVDMWSSDDPAPPPAK